jgi:protein XagA
VYFLRSFHVLSLAIALGPALFLAHSNAYAGAFLEPAGEGEIITSATFSSSARAFDANGRLIPVSSYQKFELGTYIDYGLTDWLTIVASPSIDHIKTAPAPGLTQSTTGIGDTAVGARLKIYQTEALIFSVQALLRPPLGLQTDPATRSLDQSHSVTGEIRGLAALSTTIWGYDAFADFEAGYRWNDTVTPNEWQADLTLGLHATPVFMILVQNFAAISDGRTPSNPSYYWDKEQVSGVYAFSPSWSGQIGGFLTVAGRNAGRELGPVAALWYRF